MADEDVRSDDPTAMRYTSAPHRRAWIVDRLRETGFISVASLTSDLGVSDMTVRRDLRKLEDRGEVRVVHGGVSLRHGPLHDPAFAGRSGLQADAKDAIAREASRLVSHTDILAVDAGTTAYAVARALPSDFAGTVVTHSVPVIQLLLRRDRVRVVGLGGELLHESQAFAGQMAVDAIRSLRVGTLFLGAAAVDERGVYVATDNERPTKLALIDIADRVVLLADRTKFTAAAPVLLCPLDRIDLLVTDEPLPADARDPLRDASIPVLHALSDTARTGRA
ncbi:DeoR/GlpR transcriptional regulator [Phycicoccus sp. CSK15P-2]|uniref:DeoR/GlpR family DNA-binding transcription regulator n=1 Tax=Phycicoccus sp. CSK15P-2 TaxID=2807627 RepID=UPI0019520A33|nr:DeoR/GlpR family DNA-binding transcription regulator [Phycicoccus sp. CSK15P-2]MBM6404878.1 DeoR/GlpR transcriptional regulator [Phycicoccus sp. CSK15P-2]